MGTVLHGKTREKAVDDSSLVDMHHKLKTLYLVLRKMANHDYEEHAEQSAKLGGLGDDATHLVTP
jgi:hypothetical protein